MNFFFFFFGIWTYNWSRIICWKGCPFSTESPFQICQKSIVHKCVGLCADTMHLFTIKERQSCPDFWSFVIGLKLGGVNHSTFPFYSNILVVFLDILRSHMNFRISLSISMIKDITDLQWDCAECIHPLGENGHLNNIKFSTQHCVCVSLPT